MKKRLILVFKFIFITGTSLLTFSFLEQQTNDQSPTAVTFPYKEEGLTERQAAAHLLSRFTFGARPGQVDEVVRMGLEKWFDQQLKGNLSDDSLTARLVDYDALKLSNAEILKTFPKPAQVLRMAKADGIIVNDSLVQLDKKEYRQQLAEYSRRKNFRRPNELYRQFISQKMLRAAYSNNQLHEVLTDFWFNHFNVSLTKRQCALFIPSYERDVIRPNVTGKFSELLIATAKSPAMLLYLDNFSSAGQNDDPNVNAGKFMQRLQAQRNNQMNDAASQGVIKKIKNAKKNQGLNENYAREVMELHTMGVDGGYTQTDVTQAARILTGWTLYPIGEGYGGNNIKNMIDRIGEDKLTERGFVHDGDFLFAMSRHDNKSKTVLGKNFDGSGGYKEGLTLMNILAHHPSTASFICRKIAVHFVNDDPPKALLDKMTKTFLDKDGDIKAVLTTMVYSREFWNKESLRQKTKSPFELAISAVRALNADIDQPYQLFTWVDKMGQKIYSYQAPTGFPDKAQYWINTGALLNRMNFGLSIASQQMRGINIDLLSLYNNHEPESPSAALSTYGAILMPERDLVPTIKRLTPLLNDPGLENKLENAAVKMPAANPVVATSKEDAADQDMGDDAVTENMEDKIKRKKDIANKNMLSQVVGIIIGSPEFQRK